MILGTDEMVNKISSFQNLDTYYLNSKKRTAFLTKPMNDFHSFVKKDLIKSNTNPNTNLIDFSCGKLGDLNHWTKIPFIQSVFLM